MTVIEQELPMSVRNLLDEHLDGVERVLLTSGVSRPQRLAICEDVELQVREMLWQRSQAAPTVEQARAVLAELDPPEAFLEAIGPTTAVPPATSVEPLTRTHTLALISALIPIICVMSLFLPLGISGEGRASVFVACAEIVAILLATVAIREIRRSPERWSGTGLAVFGVLALPLVVASFLAYTTLAPKYYHLIVDKAREANVNQDLRRQKIVDYNRQIEFRRLDPTTHEPVERDEELSEQARQIIGKLNGSIAQLQQANQDFAPTPVQQILFQRRKAIQVATQVVVLGLTGAAFVMLFIVAYRRCLPPAST